MNKEQKQPTLYKGNEVRYPQSAEDTATLKRQGWSADKPVPAPSVFTPRPNHAAEPEVPTGKAAAEAKAARRVPSDAPQPTPQPYRHPEPTDELPPDFPGFEDLKRAGVNTYGAYRLIFGTGTLTAEQIKMHNLGPRASK